MKQFAPQQKGKKKGMRPAAAANDRQTTSKAVANRVPQRRTIGNQALQGMIKPGTKQITDNRPQPRIIHNREVEELAQRINNSEGYKLQTNSEPVMQQHFHTSMQLLSNADAVFQRAIRLRDKDEELTANQAFSRVMPFLKFKKFDKAMFKHVDQVLTRFDFNNRVFANMADLARAVQKEIGVDYEKTGGVAPDILVIPQIARILSLEDFDKIASKYGIPAGNQQILATAIRKDAIFLYEVYKKVRKMSAKAVPAERIMKFFTVKVMEFTRRVIKEAMGIVRLPRLPFAVLTAGSVARREMFPGSDIDLAVVTHTKSQEDIKALFELMQYVEKRISATIKYLSTALKLPKDIGLQPDTGVFSFAKTPEELAVKVVRMQNTAQDVEPIFFGPRGKELVGRFMKMRNIKATKEHALTQLNDRLFEFRIGPMGNRFDIKKDFLRLPTLALRELATFFKLKVTNSFDRIRELVRRGVLDKGLGKSLIRALGNISKIRIRMHLYYESENDKAAISDKFRQEGEYVLSPKERGQLKVAHTTLVRFYQAVTMFVKTRGKEGLVKKKESLFSKIFGK